MEINDSLLNFRGYLALMNEKSSAKETLSSNCYSTQEPLKLDLFTQKIFDIFSALKNSAFLLWRMPFCDQFSFHCNMSAGSRESLNRCVCSCLTDLCTYVVMEQHYYSVCHDNDIVMNALQWESHYVTVIQCHTFPKPTEPYR